MNPDTTDPKETWSPKSTLKAEDWMAIEVFSQLLAATDAEQLAQNMAEQLRELTGARSVLLIGHVENDHSHPLIHACPSRRATMFSASELDYFCPSLTPEALPHHPQLLPEDHPLRKPLLREGIKSLLRFPLYASSQLIASLLLLDLADITRIQGSEEILTTLSPVMALALKNAFAQQRIQQQAEVLARHAGELEQRVAERTADLENANQTLAISRQHALNMMDEAIKARQLAEETAIALQFEVAERLRAEKSLREIEAKQRAMIANISDVLSIVDEEGINRYTSPNIHTLFGWTEADVIGFSAWKYLFPQDIEKMQAIFAELLATPHLTRSDECRILHQDGSYKWVQFTATNLLHEPDLNGILVNYHDITEQKQAHELLAQEKERLAVTLRSIGDGVITTDTHGCITLLNRAAESLTGWKAEEAMGLPLPTVFHIINEITHQPCENPVTKVLLTGSNVELANHTCLITRDGREMVIADSGAPIRDNQSRIIGVVLVFRDMTEKQKLSDSLQREQKLESIGLLAGGIAHDFNNLLGGIFGYLDMATESVELGNSEKTLKYLSKALLVFDRAKSLTQQLLTFSRGGAPLTKTIALAPLLRTSSQFALSGANVSCFYDLAENLWPCDCDEHQIGQVIDNIVINAKQAMPRGGKIMLTAKNITITQENRQTGPHPGKYIKISISDQGIGMPREILAHIFDPFFTTKETGHGLGLATVFSIVQRHDGWVDVESEPGRGSTFHILLPASKKSQADLTGQLPVEHHGEGSILVMEDESFMQEIVTHMLESMGYQVVCCNDAQETITQFKEREQSQSFKACILDLTIPGGMGGKETATILKQFKPNTILIAASGYSEDPVMAKPQDYGFSDRLVKPFRKKDLTELMNKLFPPINPTGQES